MGIELENTVNAKFFHKWITVSALRDILSQLEDGDELAPNRVGNLSVYRGNEADGFEQIGYIDIASETLELSGQSEGGRE